MRTFGSCVFVLLFRILAWWQSGVVFVTGTRHSSSPPPSDAGSAFRSPWWTDPNLLAGQREVDDDYDWDYRDVGVVGKDEGGESYFVEWSHYNRTELDDATLPFHAPLVPWTRGRLMKFLHKENETAFQLRNVFEESAVGRWCGGPAFLSKLGQRGGGDDDGKCLYEQRHTFQKTPRRVTSLPGLKLPQDWPPETHTTRVTMIGDGGKATVSGPRWLPDDAEQSEKLLHGDYRRIEFAEIWLALDDDDDDDEGGNRRRKVGLFVQYDGVTGELKQVFTMRQTKVPESCSSNKKMKGKGCSHLLLDETQRYLESHQLWPVLPSDNAASKAFREQTIPEFLQKRRWRCLEGICVRTDSAAGPAFRLDRREDEDCGAGSGNSGISYVRPISSDEEHELYYDVRCPDGVYVFFPKTFHPTHLSEDVCLELGCVTEHGLRRVLVAGKRSQGGLNACVYEEWGHPLSEQEEAKKIE